VRTVKLPQQPASSILRVQRTKAQTRSYYNKIGDVYDFLAERAEAPMRHAGLALLDARIGERVLEIGSGTGHSILALARAVGPTGFVFGVDLSRADRRAGKPPNRACGNDRTRSRPTRRCRNGFHLLIGV